MGHKNKIDELKKSGLLSDKALDKYTERRYKYLKDLDEKHSEETEKKVKEFVKRKNFNFEIPEGLNLITYPKFN